jgi:hypothetical protein
VLCHQPPLIDPLNTFIVILFIYIYMCSVSIDPKIILGFG